MSNLDIFQRLSSGTRVWVCGVGSLQEAKMRLLALQRNEPAEYYVCDLVERRVVMATTREQPELHAVGDDSEFFAGGRALPQNSQLRGAGAIHLLQTESIRARGNSNGSSRAR